MNLSMSNSLTSFEARRTFTTKKSEVFANAAGFGSDLPAGDPDTSLSISEWDVGTGATLAQNSGFIAISSDGTCGRLASVPINVTPNTTYNVTTKLTATTNLAGVSAPGSETAFLIGIATDDASLINESNNAAIITADFTVPNTVNKIFITVKSVDASRTGWFDYMHIWEKGFTSSSISGSLIK